MHIDGGDNKVADCLSHHYENNMGDDSYPKYIYVNANIRLDPDGKLLPIDCYTEIHAVAVRQSTGLAEKQDPQAMEAEALNYGIKDQRTAVNKQHIT